MKKNLLALTVFGRPLDAANDDGSNGSPRSNAEASMQSPPGERSGWDPFEVWRTRILPDASRDTRRNR